MDIMSIAKELGSVAFKYGENLSFEYVYSLALSMVDLVEDNEIETALVMYNPQTRKVEIHISTKHILSLANELKWGETEIIAYTRFLVKHELLHFMLKHLIPDSERPNPFLRNIVMDAIINMYISELEYLSRLEKDKSILLVTPEDWFDGKQIDKMACLIASETARRQDFTWEMYYDYLKSKLSKEIEKQDIYEISGDIVPSQEIDESTKAEMDEIIQRLADALRTRGMLAGNLLAEIEARIRQSNIHRQIKSILNNVFHGKRIMDYNTYKRPNRRFDTFPGTKKQYVSEKIVIMVDDSGSISDDLLNMFISEAYTLARVYNYKVDLFTYDVNIQDYIPHEKLLKRKLKVTGRGGTDLRRALKQLSNYPVKDIHTMVIFTDGYDDPPTKEEIPAKQTVFVFPKEANQEFCESVQEYAKVIYLS